MSREPGPSVVEALRLAQRGDAAAALEASSALVRAHPADARAHLAQGIALRMLGRIPEARAALERAVGLAPGDYAAVFELGVALELAGDARGALARFEQAMALRPAFLPARFAAARGLAMQGRFPDALATIEPAVLADPRDPFALHEKGWVLHRSGRPDLARPLLEAAAAADPRNGAWRLDAAKAIADAGDAAGAREAYESAVRAAPSDVPTLLACARFHVSHGDFEAAARHFAAALALAPGDPALPIYLAQAELVQRHWDPGWRAYALREPRRGFEAARASRGLAYRVPSLAEVAGREVTLVGEQGLGDVLFYLRFAPQLARAGATLDFAGEARLLPLLARTGIFRALREGGTATQADSPLPVLVADLPSVPGVSPVPPPLPIAPDPARLASWRAVLEAAGPRPWIGIAWRAGTPSDVLAHGLFKTLPLEALCAAVRPLGGTVLAIQRHPAAGEVDRAGAALGRPVHDLTRMNDDLDDALAVVALLDRHIGVSNTNMHLAAAAGARADVLVPFPPEWRWTAQGDSPWFPGFGVHRQAIGGDWSAALAALSTAPTAGRPRASR